MIAIRALPVVFHEAKMLRSGRCLYRLVPKAGGVSFVSRKKGIHTTYIQSVCIS